MWPKSTCSVELQEEVWNICESSPQGLLQNKISREDSRLDFQCGRSEYCSLGSCTKCNTLIYQETKGSEPITICFCLNSPLKHGRSQTGTLGRSPASAVIRAPSCHRLCSKSSWIFLNLSFLFCKTGWRHVVSFQGKKILWLCEPIGRPGLSSFSSADLSESFLNCWHKYYPLHSNIPLGHNFLENWERKDTKSLKETYKGIKAFLTIKKENEKSDWWSELEL